MLRRAPPALLLFTLASCSAGWQPVPLPANGDFAPYQQVQLWSHGHGTRLHAVRVTDSTVTGVPYLDHRDCDSCRVTFRREQVDSLRLGDPQGAFWATICSVVAILFTVGVVTGNLAPTGST